MAYGSKKLSLKKRRGVSNIIGSLIVLALVASVGSVILFQGLNQINAFNSDLNLHDSEHTNELREDIIFQNVRFDSRPSPDGTELELYLANVGSVDSTIATITVVKIDTQELIFNRVSPSPSEATVLIEDDTKITISGANLGSPPNDIWNTNAYNSSSYKITVGTSKGNFFSTIVEPFNT